MIEVRELEHVLALEGVSYGVVQPGRHDPSGIPIVRVADLEGDEIRTDNPLRVAREVERKYSRTRLSGGEVLVSIVGTVGRVAIAPTSVKGWNVARAVAVLRAANPGDTAWIRYALLSPLAQDQMNMRKTDTVQATLNLRDIKKIAIPWPSPHQRRQIASVLAALDDLIEANRTAIHALRSLAGAVFEAATIGGDTLTFGEVARQVRDTVSGGGLLPGTPYLGLEHFATDGLGISTVGDAALVESNKSRFSSGDVLYGKLRPYFRKFDRAGFDGVCSTEIWVLRGREPYGAATVSALVARPEFTDFAMQGSGGTRMPRADWKHVVAMPIQVPSQHELPTVEKRLENFWRASVDLQKEIDDLTRTRNELLPLLLSGKVRVRDIEAA